MALPPLCIMGPTASGKTALAMALVAKYPFEIISVDSAMVYKGMDIGTAKPSKEEQVRAPHHLIDIIDPITPYSVANFCTDVQMTMDEVAARGKRPLLVGGTQMYFHALQEGLSAIPSTPLDLRAQMQQRLEEEGLAALHLALSAIDPQSAMRIHPNDTQRLMRALEVYQLTGKPLSHFHQQKNILLPHCINLILLPFDRAWLHRRIEQRFIEMRALGFVEEVEALLDKWPQLSPDLPSMRSVGYRQALEYLSGHVNEADFMARGIAATRQLAKRQMTWLRHWKQGEIFFVDEADFEKKAMAYVAQFVDN